MGGERTWLYGEAVQRAGGRAPAFGFILLSGFFACQSNASRAGDPKDPELVVGHKTPPSGGVAAHAAGDAPLPPGATLMPASSADRVELDLAGQRLVVTLSDARELARLLVSRIEASKVEDRDFLLAATRSIEPWIFEGVLRIGNWALRPSGTKLAFSYRMPEQPGGIRTYHAEVVKTGEAWAVQDIASGIIHRR